MPLLLNAEFAEQNSLKKVKALAETANEPEENRENLAQRKVD
jgi:hypothetical protein